LIGLIWLPFCFIGFTYARVIVASHLTIINNSLPTGITGYAIPDLCFTAFGRLVAPGWVGDQWPPEHNQLSRTIN